MKNNKKILIKNTVIVFVCLIFFVLIVKFFPTISNTGSQKVKDEKINENFKAEALNYGDNSKDVKLKEEEQRILDEKAALDKSKEEITTDVKNEITPKTEPPAVIIELSPRKGGSSVSGQNLTTGTIIMTTGTTPVPTTSTTPTPTTSTTPSPTTNTTPIPTTSTTPTPTTSTTPFPVNNTPPEPTTSITPEPSSDTINIVEDQNLINDESENNLENYDSGNFGSRSNKMTTTGSIPLLIIGQQVSEKINNVVETLPTPIKERIEKTSNAASIATTKTAEAVASPVGKVASVTMSSTGAVAGASLSASAFLSIDALMVSDFLLWVIRLWGVILTTLGLKKRNKPWGCVYDSVTKQPLDPVYVSLENMEGKEIASAITDLDGRYGFLTQAGNFKINVHKTNYEFPSKKASGKDIDRIYSDLYFGGTINILNNGEVVTKNIPMDSIKFDWNEFEKKRKNLMRFYSKRNILFIKVADILFNLGLLITIISAITVPIIYNVIILVIYLILYIVRRFTIKPKSHGSIVEKDGGAPLSFGIIHIKRSSDEIVHKVADKMGRFFCLVPNGIYEISIDKKISDEEYIEVYKENNYEVKNGYINKRFQV